MSQSILLKIIYDRASENMDTQYAIDHWDEWVRHYFSIAEAFRRECLMEGLSQTASAIEEIIIQQRRFCLHK